MAEETGQEKSEAPSDRRREEARDEGQVAFSREVPSAALLAGLGLLLWATGPQIVATTGEIFRGYFLNLVREELSINLLYKLFAETLLKLFPFFTLFTIVMLAIGILASVLQVGVRFTLKPLFPNFGKLSPLKGFQRIFSTHSFSELLKSLFKMLVMGYIAYITFVDEIPHLMSLAVTSSGEIIRYNFATLGLILGKIVLALVILAIFDFFYQRWDLEQKLKMTKQQVKEETKQTEGNPQLRSRVRQIQREMSRARMMQEVPKADAIVVNPTHYAVAIRYDREAMDAPQVTAKGVDFLALRMKAVAQENNVPVVERPSLARELYSNVELGQIIPDRFYRAVAEVLAYVYRLKKPR